MLRHPTSIALTAIVNSVTADVRVHITESVGSRRELVANSCTHRRRRRDATKQFRRVGGVYWALEGRKPAYAPPQICLTRRTSNHIHNTQVTIR